MLSMLPVLAFVLCGLLTTYFALLGIGLRWIRIRQFLDDDTNGLDQEAAAQKQDDDYQTLISLGFKPIGRYREQFRLLDTKLDEIAMVHCELPICSYLKMLPSGIAIVELLTDDGNGRFIVTTTLDASGQASDDHDFFRQPLWGEKPEQLFQAHVVALNAREEDGFSAAMVNDLSGFAKLRKRYFRHRKAWSALTDSFWFWSASSVLTSLLIPGCIAWTAHDLCYASSLGMSVETGWTIFAVISIFVSLYLLRSATKRPSKRTAKRPILQQLDSASDKAWCQHCGEDRATQRQKYDGPCRICKNGFSLGGNGLDDFQAFSHGKDCRGIVVGALEVCSCCHEPVFVMAQTREEFILLEEKEQAMQQYLAKHATWLNGYGPIVTLMFAIIGFAVSIILWSS